jgi:hypothetical protein
LPDRGEHFPVHGVPIISRSRIQQRSGDRSQKSARELVLTPNGVSDPIAA